MTLASSIDAQKKYFSTGATRPYAARMNALTTLQHALHTYESKLLTALHTDLGKSETESFMCEIGLVYSEITWMKHHLKSLMREHTVRTPLAQFAAHSFQSPSPYGTVLIMSPWNYPVLLTLDPLVDALAAGNTAILKPSAYAPATAAVLQTMLHEAFPENHVHVVTGGRAENQELLHAKFDKIFFTGSAAVGKEVLRCAAEHLTPVTLELGGKSPCIVEKSCKLPLTARRIVFGKFINCGQTCVAPDYILCDRSIRDDLIAVLVKEIKTQLGNALQNPSYGKIINEKHYYRLLNLIDPAKVVTGGYGNEHTLRIAPTILQDVTWDDAVMQEEIFGPILPILTYDRLDDAIACIEAHPRPLALYCFTEQNAVWQQISAQCRFGGGCRNDCLIHLATSEMPFGGVGESGMGGYHGKAGFDAFSHQRSIVDKKTWLDLPVRYQPYTGRNLALIRKLLK